MLRRTALPPIPLSMRPLDLRLAAARSIDRPLPRTIARDGLVATTGRSSQRPTAFPPPLPPRRAADDDLATLAARVAVWSAGDASAPRADVELSVRMLAHGGSITVARQVVDGRVVHLDALVR